MLSVMVHEPLAPATNDGVQETLADGKVRTRHERASASGHSECPSPVSADVVEDKETIIVSPQARVNDLSDGLAPHSPEESDREAPAATLAPSESAPESLPASATLQKNPAQLPFATVTSLDNLYGIAPIAEALIKTLAGKARTGRLDELKALELLQQAVLL